MTDVVTLTEAKDHLRVNHTSEDTLIERMINGAVAYAENFINREIPGKQDPAGEIPADIKDAILLIIADRYENREAAGAEQLYKNPAAENILHFYRVNMGI